MRVEDKRRQGWRMMAHSNDTERRKGRKSDPRKMEE